MNTLPCLGKGRDQRPRSRQAGPNLGRTSKTRCMLQVARLAYQEGRNRLEALQCQGPRFE